MNALRAYARMEVTLTSVSMQSQILSLSVVDDSRIVSVGQSTGSSFDLSIDIDGGTGKTFSHEWE